MGTYSAKIQFNAPSDAAAWEMFTAFLAAYDDVTPEDQITERGAALLPGIEITEGEYALDADTAARLDALMAGTQNPNPLPEGMPQV